MPSDETLTIEIKLLTLDAEFVSTHGNKKSEKYALLSISDTRTGIDYTIKEAIFDPFFTTKANGKGSGLGFFIVYGIVEQHNGFMTLQATENHGTAISLYFPIDTTLEEHRTIPDQSRKGAETILLAEDNENVQRLTKDVLERTGYAVIEAVDGEDAIRQFLLNKDKTDFLILTQLFPGKTDRKSITKSKKQNHA
jgi:hypothetical protein